MHIPKDLHTIHSVLKTAGFSCYVVGGAVRNHVAGLRPTDYDLTSDAPPEEIMKLFRRTVPTGIDHGTVTILLGNNQYEITTFRTESGYSDARHPDSVEFSHSLEEDLGRRDFTMNALAWDIGGSRLIDIFSGVEAIREGIIKAIGSPGERFTEDPLRIMRACRFASQLGFEIEKETLDAGRRHSADIVKISAERVRDEFIKLVCGKECSRGLFLLRDMEILGLLLPELAACMGTGQKGMHAFDVFEHSVYCCEGAPMERPDLRIAALFHDLGKPGTMRRDENGTISFHQHEQLSGELTEQILTRLKFPKRQIRRIGHLVRQHMFNYSSQWSDSALRRFIARVGKEYLDDIVSLRLADAYGMERRNQDLPYLPEMKARIDALLAREDALSLRDLVVDGNDLKAQGIPRGPLLGVILNQLLETVLDDPEMNSREKLLNLAVSLYEELKAGE
jgi:tRNA nucleotidyltransferase (CCA-adding enzyme)